MKKIFLKINLLFVFMTIVSFGFCAEEGGGNPNFYPNLAAYLVGITGALVIAGTLTLLVKLLNQVVKLREIEILTDKGLEEYIEVKKASQESWWTRFMRSMTDLVPVEKEKDILLNHNYDGIQELDNNLPPWWLYGFYLSIGIAIFYIGYYHFSSNAMSSAEEYALEMQQSQDAVDRFLAKQADRIDESNLVALADVAALADGENIFNSLCIACHMQGGGGAPGSVGPNLTDDYWLHGGSIKDVFKTVKYGVPEKGMISWKDQLRPVEMHKVSSYILSLRGTNPPNAKEPQGELYEAVEVVIQDSTVTEMK